MTESTIQSIKETAKVMAIDEARRLRKAGLKLDSADIREQVAYNIARVVRDGLAEWNPQF